MVLFFTYIFDFQFAIFRGIGMKKFVFESSPYRSPAVLGTGLMPNRKRKDNRKENENESRRHLLLHHGEIYFSIKDHSLLD